MDPTPDKPATGTATALVLGGTSFVGRHLVDALVRAGWTVTLFNRGRSGPGLFPDLEQLRGDRSTDTTALAGRSWDVVVDVTAYTPEEVARSAEQLAGGAAGHYVLVSTISVYDGPTEPGADEDHALEHRDRDDLAPGEAESYGPLKVLAEQEAARHYPGLTVVRPTIVVGPHDPTDRFTSWVRRFATPGQHVAPDLDSPVQYVDVRDLADFLVHLARERTRGVLHAVAPPTTLGAVLRAAADAGGVTHQPVPLTVAQLGEAGLEAGTDLPLWLPPDHPAARGLFAIDDTRARAAGLRTRDLADTVAATLSWVESDAPEPTRGLAPARDAALVATFG